jgi:hypothetical protein
VYQLLHVRGSDWVTFAPRTVSVAYDLGYRDAQYALRQESFSFTKDRRMKTPSLLAITGTSLPDLEYGP